MADGWRARSVVYNVVGQRCFAQRSSAYVRPNEMHEAVCFMGQPKSAGLLEGTGDFRKPGILAALRSRGRVYEATHSRQDKRARAATQRPCAFPGY